MKHFLLLVCLLSVLSSKAQDYIPFPDSTAVWNAVFGSFEPGSSGDLSSSHDGYSYLMQGDSLFENMSYSNMYVRKSMHYGSCQGCPNFQTYFSHDQQPFELIGGIREDSTKKVWFRRYGIEDWEPEWLWSENYTDTTEIILFDFGMEVGDTLWLYPEGVMQALPLISIEIGSLGRREFVFNNQVGPYPYQFGPVVEGIGALSSNPFAYYSINGDVLEYQARLQCFSENDEIIYSEEILGTWLDHCDGHTLGLREFEIKVLEVYPNPYSRGSSVSLGVRIPAGVQLTQVLVYDVMGRVIPDSKFKYQGVDSDYLESGILNLEFNQPAGLYTLLLTTKNGEVFSAKVMVE
jgi:hypothetical protein